MHIDGPEDYADQIVQENLAACCFGNYAALARIQKSIQPQIQKLNPSASALVASRGVAVQMVPSKAVQAQSKADAESSAEGSRSAERKSAEGAKEKK